MKASEVREMSIADLRERIEAEKANLDSMKPIIDNDTPAVVVYQLELLGYRFEIQFSGLQPFLHFYLIKSFA